MKVIVIGGGPAGMMAAIEAAKNQNEVTLLEKKNTCGRKLLITGKGRCNITSSLPIEEFIKNIPGNGRFLYSAFQHYTNQDIIAFLEQQGVDVKEERGNRVFPVSDRSQSVLEAFLQKLKAERVIIKTNTPVQEIVVEEKEVKGVKLETGEFLRADKVILATGGKSYPATGSTGDGYEMVKKLGHTITPIRASLVPLSANGIEKIENAMVQTSNYQNSLALCKNLQGLSLKNVSICIKDKEKNKTIYEDFGEMLFTHFGISGPTILSGSAHLLRYPQIEEKLRKGDIIVTIDLKPALSEEKLKDRILRDFDKYRNKEIKNSLQDLLPQKLIMPVIHLAKIEENKQVNSITKEERRRLIEVLKNLTLTIQNFRPIEDAIITAGGISIKEINPKTMESKLIKGLYFAGEIIDVDAYTGGFNLQIAYSTGYTAGQN